MGFFGRFVYSAGAWHEEATTDAFLAIDVHDSDIATVDYRSAKGEGRFYLGFQPRDYFEDPTAGGDVDADAEAAGLAAWAEEVLGTTVRPDDIRPLMAGEGVDPEDDFVEETVVRLLRVLRLPPPDGLPAGDGS